MHRTIEIWQEFSRATRGDLTEVLFVLAELERNGTSSGRAWSIAFRSLLGLLAPGLAPEPRSSEVEAEISTFDTTDDVLLRACNLGALRCVLDFDLEGLRQWHDVSQTLTRVRGQGRDLPVHTCIESWSALFEGESAHAQRCASQVSSIAASVKEPALLIETTVLRALSALSRGQVSEAIAIARLGSRMARTEELLVHEYLANIVLARLRRYTGRSYLAQRILDALASVVPDPWLGWISWEMFFAGAPSRSAEILVERLESFGSGHSAVSAIELLDAAHDGDERRFSRHAGALMESVVGWSDIALEARALVAAVSPEPLSDEVDPKTRTWLEGETDALPALFRGLCIPEPVIEGGGLPAVVVVYRATGARRMLRLGLPLVQSDATSRVSEQSLALGRVHTAIAALAFAGAQGLAVEELFHRVYGFKYVASKHDGVLRTLVYRVRRELAERGRLLAREDRLVLEPVDVLITPEPRGVPQLEDLILRSLSASAGRASARETATALGVPLRTVQAAMRRLVEDGVCAVERDGRQIAYTIEDTTFAEPSLQRMKPQKGA